ncbi:ArsR/SmtB family transcription factor [Enterococcus faecalis]|uniref:ArsR/SmtB family transcription factor n=1 Tax=Enterococcus faecalis TaxID=1351 RepID=UPI00035486C7|nr:winged helix-turn-helix domain-containing protein [Enterococcus faecalis]EPH72109.1 transcriptional regulator, ArsR family [Enterococcus faecalis 20-SD-BW-06]EPI03164.1 transcriptional regulator, ArsR family [Enterococcus faecalis 20-SD-BW-08]
MTNDFSMQLKLIHGFSNKTRYNILRILKNGEQNVTDLLEQIGGSQSNISQHLACLRDCGLIEKRMERKYYYYSITTPKIIQLMDVLDETIQDFEWTGESIECKHHMV